MNTWATTMPQKAAENPVHHGKLCDDDDFSAIAGGLR